MGVRAEACEVEEWFSAYAAKGRRRDVALLGPGQDLLLSRGLSAAGPWP